ncbi:hypothetical protein CCHR01_00424 [Colletotrichum chrysophilum]|uniref:Uncharacterized protein n=1 Tax=Colletotrichum chrysophilum TaxID=1836956 RepID=A0AAD9ER78_9PEZI|nr:hypothetical protein CCHR01_00424 [Colletotrichum chrysophilum]
MNIARASNNLLSNGTNYSQSTTPQQQHRQGIKKFLPHSGDGTLDPRPHRPGEHRLTSRASDLHTNPSMPCQHNPTSHSDQHHPIPQCDKRAKSLIHKSWQAVANACLPYPCCFAQCNAAKPCLLTA